MTTNSTPDPDGWWTLQDFEIGQDIAELLYEPIDTRLQDLFCKQMFTEDGELTTEETK